MAFATHSSMTSKIASKSSSPAPFRATARSAARRQSVVVRASQEPNDTLKNAVAAFAAAAITLTPFTANATGSGIMPSRNRGEDNAARSFLDSQENKGPAVQSRSTDPNSGKVGPDADPIKTPASFAGPKKASNTPVPLEENVQKLKGLNPLGSNSPSAQKANSKLDREGALRSAREGAASPVAFFRSAAAPSLQVNIGVPESLDEQRDAAKAAEKSRDKSGDKAKALRAQDVKKQEPDVPGQKENPSGKPLQQQLSWSPSSLQVNVGNSTDVFGRGQVGTTKDQINQAGEELKENAANPGQAAKNAATRFDRAAGDVLSNPTGGAEQSKRAAAQLSDANAEIPKALAKGVSGVKDAVTP